jgi:serine/threonine-protein kinase
MDYPSPNPSPPDGPDPRDEALGAELERTLEALDSGGLAPLAPTYPAELSELRAVVERLHRLARNLADPPTVDTAASTRERPAEAGHAPGAGAGPTRLGKFEVVRPLGRGGHASTLLAFDPDLRRHVVLKLYHAARTPEEQELVLREGRALARVRSPYVAQCHSAERQGGLVYLVVEYIPGQDLTQRQRSRPLDVAQALGLVRQLAEGLAAVHACGLLHRDIKPANILLGDDGVPRLVDFGLAVPLASDDLGRVSGTLAYMAPEQARGEGERIDARTDVFGLGAVLYELLTGRPPYRAGRSRALAEEARAGHVAPPAECNPRLPRAANDLCLRCLAPDPSGRFASAAELAEAVRRWQRRRWPRYLLAAAAALLLVAAAGLGYRFLPPHPAPTPEAAAKPGPEKPTAMPARLPDGRELRRDFALKVEVLGGELDPDAGVYVLKVGQLLRFRLVAQEDCFVGLWDVTADKVIQLFPNGDDPDNRLPKGEPRLVPGAKTIRAKAPSGVEYVHLVASTRPWRQIPGQRLGPFDVFANPGEKKRCLEALRDLDLVDPGEAVAEAIVRLQVRP